jgi:hypothetical protein
MCLCPYNIKFLCYTHSQHTLLISLVEINLNIIATATITTSTSPVQGLFFFSIAPFSNFMFLFPGNQKWESWPPIVVVSFASVYCGCTTLVDLDWFFSLLIYRESVGLLGRRISPSQGRCLHKEQHKQKINADRHRCLDWDWNPRPQCTSGRRRFMP